VTLSADGKNGSFQQTCSKGSRLKENPQAEIFSAGGDNCTIRGRRTFRDNETTGLASLGGTGKGKPRRRGNRLRKINVQQERGSREGQIHWGSPQYEDKRVGGEKTFFQALCQWTKKTESQTK